MTELGHLCLQLTSGRQVSILQEYSQPHRLPFPSHEHWKRANSKQKSFHAQLVGRQPAGTGSMAQAWFSTTTPLLLPLCWFVCSGLRQLQSQYDHAKAAGSSFKRRAGCLQEKPSFGEKTDNSGTPEQLSTICPRPCNKNSKVWGFEMFSVISFCTYA